MTARRSERGSGAVLVLVMLVVLGSVGALAADLGGLLVAKRRAAAAADLAALAAASAVQRGAAGCPAAAVTATANRAQLVSCHQGAQVVTVDVAVPVHTLPGIREVRDRARAGPS